jgi:hypothetical protein
LKHGSTQSAAQNGTVQHTKHGTALRFKLGTALRSKHGTALRAAECGVIQFLKWSEEVMVGRN